jgi:hypothetical protein
MVGVDFHSAGESADQLMGVSGCTHGGYVQQPVQRGGMGEVWRAFDDASDRIDAGHVLCAITLIPSQRL